MADADRRLLYTVSTPGALRLYWRANGDLDVRIERVGASEQAVAVVAAADVPDLIATLQAGPE
jgi:hypothetical protein